MNTWEEAAYIGVRRVRDLLLTPLAAPLARLGVPPSLVSLVGVVCAFSTCLTLPQRPRLALIGFLGALLCDAIDGALARRLGRGSVRGKLIDQFADLATFAALMAAVALAGLASPEVILVTVGATASLLVLGFCYHTARRPDGRGLRPRGGFFAHFPKSLIYAALALYLVLDIDRIGPTLGLANTLALVFACGFSAGLLKSPVSTGKLAPRPRGERG